MASKATVGLTGAAKGAQARGKAAGKRGAQTAARQPGESFRRTRGGGFSWNQQQVAGFGILHFDSVRVTVTKYLHLNLIYKLY